MSNVPRQEARIDPKQDPTTPGSKWEKGLYHKKFQQEFSTSPKVSDGILHLSSGIDTARGQAMKWKNASQGNMLKLLKRSMKPSVEKNTQDTSTMNQVEARTEHPTTRISLT